MVLLLDSRQKVMGLQPMIGDLFGMVVEMQSKG
jgi:hypothetical protein